MNATEMTALRTSKIVARVILEVAGTISTNGIQELSRVERAGSSEYLYVRNCLIATAYNTARSYPNFNMSMSAFHEAVCAKVKDADLCDDCGGSLENDGCICDDLNDAIPECTACGCTNGTCSHAA
jgi:hypothetical protein